MSAAHDAAAHGTWGPAPSAPWAVARRERLRRRPGLRAERLGLADGRNVDVRPVQAQDAAATQRFVQALSASSRHARFHIGLHELPPGLLRLLTDVDQRCHVALVAIAPGEGEEVLDPGRDDSSDIVAEARYVLSADGEAEFALSVADAWQGRGLGTALLRRLGRHAARRGVRHLFGEVLRSNAAMLAILRREGARFGSVPGTALLTQATLDLQRIAAPRIGA